MVTAWGDRRPPPPQGRPRHPRLKRYSAQVLHLDFRVHPTLAPGDSGRSHVATPSGFRPTALSNTMQKLVAKAVNHTLEFMAQAILHPSQTRFVAGRQMGDHILLSLAAMDKALILGDRTFGTTRFDISAAVPSVRWEWLWAVLESLDLPSWVTRTMRSILMHFTATVFINAVVYTQASFPVPRGIQQGCPTCGSIWAIFFDPVVLRLTSALPSPALLANMFLRRPRGVLLAAGGRVAPAPPAIILPPASPCTIGHVRLSTSLGPPSPPAGPPRDPGGLPGPSSDPQPNWASGKRPRRGLPPECTRFLARRATSGSGSRP